MEGLCPELIDMIFSHIESEVDVARLRLVQSSFAQIGHRYLYNTVYVYPSLGSVRNLWEISRDPEKASLVKTLIFGDGIDIPRPKLRRTCLKFPSKNLSPEDDTPSYLARVNLRNYLRECYKFQKSSAFLRYLINSFARLPNLEEIIFGHPYFPPRSRFTQRWENELARKAGYRWDKAALRTFRAVGNAIYYSKTKLSSFQYTYLERVKMLESIYAQVELNRNSRQSNAFAPHSARYPTEYPSLGSSKTSTFAGKNVWPSLFKEFLKTNSGNYIISMGGGFYIDVFLDSLGIRKTQSLTWRVVSQDSFAQAINNLVGRKALEIFNDSHLFEGLEKSWRPRPASDSPSYLEFLPLVGSCFRV